MKSFFVINYNINKKVFEPYDIMPHLIETYKKEKNKSKDHNSIKEFIKSEAMYMWWSRCEYEIILADWPSTKHLEKWDIYKQILMNIDIITDIFIENISNGKSKAIKN